MKDTDVRIGNWVDYGHGRAPVQITGKDLAEGIEDRPFRGIPLSPEWLERLGFKKDSQGEYYDPREVLFTVIFDGDSVNHVWDASFTGADIQYVHQVQNLFFALTGKELTLKP